MKFRDKIVEYSDKISSITLVKAIREGLLNMIPVLIIGAFALVLMTFPITVYQNFITSFLDGFLYNFFNFVYSATFGVLSVYMTFSISRSYMKNKADKDIVHGGAIFASLLCFFILAGAFSAGFGLDNMGPKSMFLAIIAGLGGSSLYLLFFKLMSKRRRMLLSEGADHNFNKMLQTFFPILFTALLFAFVNVLIIKIFKVDSFSELYINALNKLFSKGEVGFVKGFFFVLLSSLLWFFGIHGSDALEGVMQNYFAPGLLANQEALLAGNQATNVLTKEFFDCFVLMGGCGVTICLLIAILAFSRNRSRRGLGYTASVPMLFNINELMVFGLPIIFNPIMLIPFLLTPLVCYSVSYLAISSGLVPMISSEVFWTTPVLIGGYVATSSVMGSLLQLVNISLGVLIYWPFVRILDKASAKRYQESYNEFMNYYIANEAVLQQETLCQMNNIYGDFAKELSAELRHDLVKNISIYYQPQYNFDGTCFGVEALLRWKHPIHGNIYPPLIIKLATEINVLEELEQTIIKRSLSDYRKLEEMYGENLKLSINVTGSTVIKDQFVQFVKNLEKDLELENKNICFEVTEQVALQIDEDTYLNLEELKKMGVSLAIDDFSMGHTSIQYLRRDLFDMIKIDGSLVKGLLTKENCKEIISSIVDLANSLNLKVLAEYVETEKQRDILHEIGCDKYQGYLYSMAKPIE